MIGVSPVERGGAMRGVIVASLILGSLTFGSPMLGAGAALAQPAGPPAQIGNRANGFDYQPTQGGIQAREKAAGITPDPQQSQQEDQTLLQLDHKLLGNQLLPPGTPAAK
jgi:hypothetical protein